MTENKSPKNTQAADVERSAEDIRRDIAKAEESISRTVDQIGERIKEKLNWREYVKSSPYWALGAAAGLGYIASRMLLPRATPLERIMGTLADELHGSFGGLRAGTSGPDLVKMTLVAIATKAAVGWIQDAASTAVISDGAMPRPRKGHGSTMRPKAAASKKPKSKTVNR